MRTIKLFSSLAVILLALLLACNSGQEINGQIVDAQGNPVEGATLNLIVWDQKKDDAPTKTIETTKTDRNGRFEISTGGEQPETRLMLGVQKEGYKIVTLKFTPLLIRKNEAVFKDYKVILEKNE